MLNQTKDKKPTAEEIQKEFEEFIKQKYGGTVRFVQQPSSNIELNEQDTQKQTKTIDLKFDLKPKEVKQYLDRYVIKQHEAKKALAIAVCDHYNHVRKCHENPKLLETDYSKQNIIVLGSSGVGKTWLLQTIAAGALKKGFTVVHYTLELNETYVGLRYDTVFSGISTQNIKFHREEVKKIIDSLEGRMVIKYYPTRAATVNTISAHLKQLELKDIKPDLVIVDYADILRDNSGMREVRHQLGSIYEDLRGLAGEFEVPLWTASQANRSALDEEVIEAQKIAEAYSKIMIADFVLIISRKAEDKLSHTARCHIIKNRFGQDGITYPMSMNTNLGKIEIYESTSMPGKTQQGKMDNSEEFKRKLLASKYNDMKNTEVEGFE